MAEQDRQTAAVSMTLSEIKFNTLNDYSYTAPKGYYTMSCL